MNQQRGFSLTEMLLAVMLTALIVIGLATIFSAALRNQVQGYQKNVIQAGELAALNALTRDISDTTRFVLPPAPCSVVAGVYTCNAGAQEGDYLQGCTNFDGVPGDALQPMRILNPSVSMRVYQYCFTPIPAANPYSELWYYWQESPGSPPYAALTCPPVSWPACGAEAAAPWVTTKLAELVGRETDYANYFRRPAYLNNAVEIHFQVGSGTAAVTADTLVSAMKPVRSISP